MEGVRRERVDAWRGWADEATGRDGRVGEGRDGKDGGDGEVRGWGDYVPPPNAEDALTPLEAVTLNLNATDK